MEGGPAHRLISAPPSQHRPGVSQLSNNPLTGLYRDSFYPASSRVSLNSTDCVAYPPSGYLRPALAGKDTGVDWHATNVITTTNLAL
jgi:hypothetical protein